MAGDEEGFQIYGETGVGHEPERAATPNGQEGKVDGPEMIPNLFVDGAHLFRRGEATIASVAESAEVQLIRTCSEQSASSPGKIDAARACFRSGEMLKYPTTPESSAGVRACATCVMLGWNTSEANGALVIDRFFRRIDGMRRHADAVPPVKLAH